MSHRYFPHTEADQREMLSAVGLPDIDALFRTIPESCRMSADALPLGRPMSEWDLTERLESMAANSGGDWSVFVNAGSQRHHIPSVVPALANRSEFLTAYTPYQPEMSQGTLQAIFEYQTLIARLTGLDVANASMYDGATAMAEAVLMAMRITKRTVVAVSGLVHPHWREVLDTYLAPIGATVHILPPLDDGTTDIAELSGLDKAAALVMQSPNFLGCIENIAAAANAVHEAGGLLACGCSEPFALGAIKSPGALGADIAFGEGQSLGLSQSFGGPGLGLMAAKAEYMRQIPGRLIGQTLDNRGQRAFVLTLATREQHIRRGKAVSNICSNAGHAALTAAVFMAAAGGEGFRALAAANRNLAEYAKARLRELGFKPLSGIPTFNEFAMLAPATFADAHKKLQTRKIFAGLPLSALYPQWDNAWLFGITETVGKKGVDSLIESIREAMA